MEQQKLNYYYKALTIFFSLFWFPYVSISILFKVILLPALFVLICFAIIKCSCVMQALIEKSTDTCYVFQQSATRIVS